jgi:hypothetical protein
MGHIKGEGEIGASENCDCFSDYSMSRIVSQNTYSRSMPCVKHVSFPWPLLEAALTILNVSLLLKTFLDKKLMKTKEITINAISNAF